ncbi:MAG: hypothetical protein P8Z37_08480 [Acidobacteriota bacterium]
MSDQTATLIEDHGEWVLIIDSDEDELERAWESLDAAVEELRQEGWEVFQGPARINTELEGLDRFDLVGYRLRRWIQ